MSKQEGRNKAASVVTLGSKTNFNGLMKFSETLHVHGTIKGTIEGNGALIVAKDAVVNVDCISVSSLTVFGTVIGNVVALDKVDMMTGAKVEGDVTAARLRIADGVLFEGKCNMTGTDKEVEIFSRPAEEIKAELLRSSNASRGGDASRGSEVSNVSDFSKGSDVSRVSEFSKESDISKGSDFSKGSDISNESDVSNVREFSKESDVSNGSDVSKESDKESGTSFGSNSFGSGSFGSGSFGKNG